MEKIGRLILMGILSAVIGFGVGLILNNWEPGQIQAIGSIMAIGVAIFVPWKIDKNKRLAEEKKEAELKKLSLKVIGYEAWLMKEFFLHSDYALISGDKNALESFSGESAPVDPKSPFILEYGKYSIIKTLPDQITTAYMNAVSRRFLLINFMRAQLSNLKDIGSEGSYSKEMALNACHEGEFYCDKIIEAAKKECPDLKFRLKPKEYAEET